MSKRLAIKYNKCYTIFRVKETANTKGENNMEMITVKTVKGYKVERYADGSKGHYFVNVREGKGFREFHTFKTIKAAVEFIEKCL